MDIAIVSSTKDKASTNIKNNLINNFSFHNLEQEFNGNWVYKLNNKNGDIKLYTINSELIKADDLDRGITADIFLFISRHKAKEDRASLTCHPIGNFGKAENGGKENVLCISPSTFLKTIISELAKNAQGSGYEATVEATHHGPFMEKPLLFVELGSSEKYWDDKNGGSIAAKSIINAIEKCIEQSNYADSCESVFVIGGNHYNYAANKILLRSNFSVGHICSKHNLAELGANLIKGAMEKTLPNSKFALLDWKGLGKEKHRILNILKENKIEYKKNDKFLSEF